MMQDLEFQFYFDKSQAMAIKEYEFLEGAAYRFRVLDCGWNMKSQRYRIVTETTDGGTKKIVRKKKADINGNM